MSESAKTNLVALRDARESAIELITQRYSEDVIDEDELERRLEAVQDASRLADIEELIDDLQPSPGASGAGDSQALVPATGASLKISDASVPDRRRYISVFGDARHEGTWTPARQIKAFNALGDTSFDFRDARLGPGEVTVKVRSMLGDVTIVVPPGMPVDLDCSTILGDQKRYTPTPAVAGEDVPRVCVEGVVMLGDIRVEERLPGESRGDAKRRRKRAHKLEKQARKRAHKLEKQERKRLEDQDKRKRLEDKRKRKRLGDGQ